MCAVAACLYDTMDLVAFHTDGSPSSKIETPNVKKRHKRAKSGTNKNTEREDGA